MNRLLSYFLKGLIGGIKELPGRLRELVNLPQQLLTLIKYICRVGFKCFTCSKRCKDEIDIPPEIYKRADPMVYSQQWLMSMGLSVTWNNPDIQLYLSGNPVPSGQLEKDTEYEVRVRVWNNSTSAPAPGLPVHLIFFGFGAGTAGSYLGKRLIDLGAKATSQCPAFASFVWKTPATAGHYCLQASLDWPDDANPNNNIGQENTDVGKMQSPANFEFHVTNEAAIERKLFFEVDDYQLPELRDCKEPPDDQGKEIPRIDESKRRWNEARKTQGFGQFSTWGNDWNVIIEPQKWILQAGETVLVKVKIEALDAAFIGTKSFNVNVFAASVEHSANKQFIGGVTLVAEKE